MGCEIGRGGAVGDREWRDGGREEEREVGRGRSGKEGEREGWEKDGKREPGRHAVGYMIRYSIVELPMGQALVTLHVVEENEQTCIRNGQHITHCMRSTSNRIYIY